MEHYVPPMHSQFVRVINLLCDGMHGSEMVLMLDSVLVLTAILLRVTTPKPGHSKCRSRRPMPR